MTTRQSAQHHYQELISNVTTLVDAPRWNLSESSSANHPFANTVSVIIPCYNRLEQTISAARSALVQTVSPLEVIIVDDASSDQTSEFDFTSIDKRVRSVRHHTNQGGGAARNSGLDAAAGEWVALLDSDDLWVPDKLERQFAKLNDPLKLDLFAAANVLMVIDGKPIGPYNKFPPRKHEPISEFFLIHGGTFQTSTLLLPTVTARKCRFDPRLRRHQDWDFVLRLLQHGNRVSYVHDVLAIYDQTPLSTRISQNKDVLPTLEWFALSKSLLTAKAKHVFYMKNYFVDHFRQARPQAVAILARLSLAYPAGLLRSCVHLARKKGLWP